MLQGESKGRICGVLVYIPGINSNRYLPLVAYLLIPISASKARATKEGYKQGYRQGVILVSSASPWTVVSARAARSGRNTCYCCVRYSVFRVWLCSHPAWFHKTKLRTRTSRSIFFYFDKYLVLIVRNSENYKGSASRAADAARYARARRFQLHMKGQKEEAHELVQLAI